mmetsp:Transcript_8551/g.13548  ORF Transcript_8551/g.13548 Transcript_8551/m.13548 type:complete len:116 (-) Transcript_8551:322-669(-)
MLGQAENILYCCMIDKDMELAKTFLECCGADCKREDLSVVFLCACSHGSLEMVQILISKDIDVNAKNRYGQTPFLCACEAGNVEIARLLMERDDVEVKAEDKDGNNALYFACQGQ